MDKFKISPSISYVYIDDNIVLLDFSTGEFYLLDKNYFEFFYNLKKYGYVTESKQFNSTIKELLNLKIIQKCE